jgi:hypothetical protein
VFPQLFAMSERVHHGLLDHVFGIVRHPDFGSDEFAYGWQGGRE